MADKEQMHAVVYGHVQGVSFRYFTTQAARRLGLTGWVQNRADGTVEIRAEGPRLALLKLQEFLMQGPPAARVTHVEVKWSPVSHPLSTFQIRHDSMD